MNRPRLRLRAFTAVAVALLAAASLALPAVAKNVTPKPDGGYVSAFKKSGFSAVFLQKGKITQLIVNAKYKKKGKVCRTSPESTEDLNYIVYNLKKPKKPKASGKFDVKGSVKEGPYKGAKARIKGRFKSSKKASFTASAKWNGCKTGKIKVKKASFRQGG